jgi:hypothetical protein
MKTKETNTWKPFWFEANQFFGWIRNIDDWRELREAYPDYDDNRLLEAKKADDDFVGPNYGFRREHQGTHTLRDFFAENNMKLE